MKFRAEVIAVECVSPSLRVKVQAVAVRDARWREMQSITFDVADTIAQRRAFHVGRIVTIEVKPQ